MSRKKMQLLSDKMYAFYLKVGGILVDPMSVLMGV